ncbi:MAG: acetyl-CoA carboxylase biotin carboxylase subunit [Gemmatimonadales bacterium]|nr:MAG: acetyl-CoA carboxylase biotin carboxylase subunit [Gemmatimonadales bacterium]
MKSVLIANRGEIAVRIIRACRELGLRSIAVYSEADRQAPHVLLADEAYLLGPAPSAESYLRVDRLLEVARRAGADAIHPGYGFLAERAAFAGAVAEAGFIFVGPTADTISAMGDKTEARRRMEAAGVPIVPGITHPLESGAEARRISDEIGYPVLLKAAAGGGGKGMRVVERSEDVERAFDGAAREAQGAFGDGAVYVEKYLGRPRHIEIQLLGDTHGNIVHLAERECSIQRRHQKLVEEAPSPVLDEAGRAAMGDAAIRAARAVDYTGAGTVEFLWQDGEFYFLEMNTRIQVEHPVTELVTGVDLVQWQLRVAAGEAIPFADGSGVPVTGHAIECRITSEDAEEGFLPSTGRIDHLEIPQGPGVRWDGGIRTGFEVGLHYDPLLGKLICYAPTRLEAIDRMARALEEFQLRGVSSCAAFHRRVMAEPAFRSGELSIRYLEERPELTRRPTLDADERRDVAALAVLLEAEYRKSREAPRMDGDGGGRPLSHWQQRFAATQAGR